MMYVRSARDRGAILPLVLVIVVVLSLVVVATATFAATTLRHGQVVESRADRLAAAQAGMNDAIEQLELQRPLSLCATVGGTGSGTNYTFPEVINGSTVEVNCRLVNGALPNSDGFALVITGEGMAAGTPTIDLDNGGQPEIKGPVYVHDPTRIELKHTTTLYEGDLVYQDTAATVANEDPTDTCDIDPSTTTDLEFDRVRFSPPITNLSFDPSLRGMFCVNRTWDQLFGAPAQDPLLAGLTAPPTYNPTANSDGCKVFEPGHYTSPPTLGKNNYFMSGVYHFDNLGLIELNSKEILTFGNAGIAGFPAIDNSPCDYVRTAVDPGGGATLYVSGNTHFDLKSNPSGIDVSGRQIGSTRVALQVLSTSLDPNSTGLLTSANGNGREAAFHGQFWAPESSLLFLTIPAKKSAILRGGAVIAAIRGKVSAAGTDGFLIEVATGTSTGDLQIEAVATNPEGSTTVRSILDYRSSTGQTATLSRRVIWD